VEGLDFDRTRQTYWEHNEFLCLPRFLPQAVIEECLIPSVVQLKPQLNRTYIPGHKKGGSVSYFQVRRDAPVFLDLYRSPAFMDFSAGSPERRSWSAPKTTRTPAPCTITPSRETTSGFTKIRPITSEQGISSSW
jgi:hypothetical protein